MRVSVAIGAIALALVACGRPHAADVATSSAGPPSVGRPIADSTMRRLCATPPETVAVRGATTTGCVLRDQSVPLVPFEPPRTAPPER